MDTVTISPKFQVVIPKKIRERLGLLPGQKLMAMDWDGHVLLTPDRPIAEAKGFLKGIDTRIEREEDRL